MDVIQDVGAYAGFAAVVGLAVLAALYFSQARDLRRLREWAGRAPERAAEQAAQAAVTPEQAAQEAAKPAPSGAVKPIPAVKPAAAGAKPGLEGKPAPAAQPGKAPTPVGKPATAAATAPATASGAAATAASGAAPTTATGPAPATPAGAPAKDKPGEPAKAADGGPAPAKPADGAPAPAEAPATPAPASGGPAPATPLPRPGPPPVLPGRPAPPVRSPAAAASTSQSTAVLPASAARLRDRGRGRRGGREGLSPRYIALIVSGVIVIGGGAVFGISQLGGDDEPASSGGSAETPQEPVNPSLVTVSVLNGTTVPGLAAQIGDEVETAGFQRGNVANALDQQRTTSTVLFAPGREREARVVARKLDIATIEPIDPDSQALGGNASVVVIVGSDQTG